MLISLKNTVKIDVCGGLFGLNLFVWSNNLVFYSAEYNFHGCEIFSASF